ncbi:BNR-4 repeat-containing protein [Candidatus Solirubrobacter pratensis]|uniref:BNR-4 repeat-containing protein n=1 Tax=Candidatus Solirubrobacter pratensis TaxID=1298857 RepID=UPI000408D93D|nr:BNR-4 repeat-containing protein [Candidatus Solirubrobacter pratensis]
MPDRELGAGSWSYFGDPRAISHDDDIFTGWISTGGNVWVARYSASGKLHKQLIYRGLGRDDHNNPALAFRRDGRLVVFFAPHSGRHLPRGEKSEMRYRMSLRPFAIDEWGPVHAVGTNAPGGLGYTYPNAIQQQERLWLFWRGGGWNPTFSYTTDYRDWAPARELVTFGHEQRPYAKYAGDGGTRIHGIFTNGHPTSWKNSLFYACCEDGGLFAADGRNLGSLSSVPLNVTALDPVYRYSDRGGRAWGHDIALEDGKPRVVYTRRVADRDTFYYAHFNGTRWISRKIVEAGAGRNSFRSGGASFDHEDPRIVYLSRTIGRWNQVEAWVTFDHGRTWQTRRLTSAEDGYAIRPVVPRGLRGRRRVLYVHGDERTRGYRDFRTRIHALDV